VLYLKTLAAHTVRSIDLPQFTIEQGENYTWHFEDYYTAPDMSYSIISNLSNVDCDTYLDFTAPNMVEEVRSFRTNGKTQKIAFESSSKIVSLQSTDTRKLFYLGFYTNDLDFSLYNISDYLNYETKDPASFLGGVNLQKSDGFYEGCDGINFRDQSIFYTFCSTEEGDIYIVDIRSTQLGE